MTGVGFMLSSQSVPQPRTEWCRGFFVGGILQETFKLWKMPRGGARPGTGGRQPGSGRPPKELSEFKRWLQDKAARQWTSEEDMRDIWRMTVARAKAGDAGARADVFKYVLGNPPQTVEVTGDQKLRIEYVNDWRTPDSPTLPAPGPTLGPAAGSPADDQP